jgi:23S rRNA pseudouridine2605 synthase
VDDGSIRINKYISQAGVASRRGADKLITDGHVQINGKIVKDLSTKVDPKKDTVKVQGKIIKPQNQLIYLMFHKPKSTLTTMEDPLERKTVADYLAQFPVRLYPVGRLDWNTEGLLLFTNDGDFANKITHPQTEIPKTYIVKVEGEPKPEKIEKLKKGVTIVGGKVRFRSIERMKKSDTKHSWFKVVLTQGLNRQIRNMFEKIGHDVLKLQRISIGSLELGNLQRGDFQLLTETQYKKIFIDPDRKPKKKRMKSTKRDLPDDD